MKTNHTPGEWKLQSLARSITGFYYSIFSSDKGLDGMDKCVAICHNEGSARGIFMDIKETEANAKLIAAAPDLLNALNVLPENTAFAHVTDVPLMIEKAANLIEQKAINDGNPDAHASIIQALLLIAQNHRIVTHKATK